MLNLHRDLRNFTNNYTKKCNTELNERLSVNFLFLSIPIIVSKISFTVCTFFYIYFHIVYNIYTGIMQNSLNCMVVRYF